MTLLGILMEQSPVDCGRGSMMQTRRKKGCVFFFAREQEGKIEK